MKSKLRKIGINKKLLSFREISKLEHLMNKWAKAEIFYKSKDVEIAERLLEITLCHTYLFGKFTLPSYASHIFYNLRDLPPADDKLGEILKTNSNVFQGELFTNNIFGSDKAHSHYLDIVEAYRKVRKVSSLDKFTRMEERLGFDFAINNSVLWNKSMINYTRYLEEITKDPLTTYLIALVSEDTISEGYKTTLENLNSAKKFCKYRIFMKKHIELDQNSEGHGSACVKWVNYYFRKFKPSKSYVKKAINNACEFIEKRLKTYEF